MRPIIIDIKGVELDYQEKDVLGHPLVAGVILFTRNFVDITQLKELVQQIRLYSKNELLISVDHEGGRVQRFREGFTALPAAGDLLKFNDLKQAKAIAYSSAWVMASELIDCDIDLSFAPVLDLNIISDVIKKRAFSSSIDSTVQLAQAYIMGMHAAGMRSTGKHFPGHGSVKADSHIDFPIDNRTKNDIFHLDLIPFKALIANKQLNAVMPSHVIYQECDSQPAGFSNYWLQEILRNELKFEGVIISDDISMKGASFAGNHVSRAERAISAGCDLVLACNDSDAAISILDNLVLPKMACNNPVSQLRHSKNNCSLPLTKNPKWIENTQILQRFAEQV